MSTKALNFKMDEADIREMKEVASVFNITVTDLIKDAVREYISKMKKDPFYRLTANVCDASVDETEEVLAEIENMSDDDLTVVSSEKVYL